MKIIITITAAMAVFISLNAESGMKNRLAKEQSPYLQQHAGNPVDWFPWGEEAFKKAKAENKPIFLSIGYSTCHWCHVMEEESFEDEDVAELMNKAFVNIKVDREERPDIDAVYMAAAHAMNNQGGWPLNLVLTPDRKPFFAMTYIPKESKYGITGMMDLITRIEQAWKEKKQEILNSADQLHAILNTNRSPIPAMISPTISNAAFNMLDMRYDYQNGGFGNRMKFPTTQNLLFLINFAKNSQNKKVVEMLSKTLQEMRRGGIYDQVGHGFHRYATDPEWKIPHFEKMLYDNAALLLTYAEAAESSLFSDEESQFYKQTVNNIFTYLSRDMASENGAFYAAEDADSEGEEGKFYLWHPDELKKILKDDYKLIEDYYDLEMMVEHGRETGTYILILKEFPSSEEQRNIGQLLTKLYDVREKRVHPFKDKKILCDWNGFTIAALAVAARRSQNQQFIDAAEKSAKFCLGKLFDLKTKTLYHITMNGEVSVKGKLDDYAYLSWGLTELYLTTSKPEYLKSALFLAELLREKFVDTNGLIYMVEKEEKLIFRPQSDNDGPIPSGGSIAVKLLYKLGELTGNIKLTDSANLILSAQANGMNQYPTAFMMNIATIEARKPPHKQIIAIVGKNYKNAEKEVKELRAKLSNSVSLTIKNSGNAKELNELIPFAEGMTISDSRIDYYLCHENRCEAPVSSLDDLMKLLEK